MDSMKEKKNKPARFGPYADLRTDGYVLLAALLSRAPSGELLHVMRNLVWEEGVPAQLAAALKALGRAGLDIPPDAREEEFNRLFLGLGRGELMPYASWYREGKIQSLPLASLRKDLMLLGIVRQAQCPEPEDHAGALCEIMALISRKQRRVPLAAQAEFFRKHLAPWLVTFFRDLQSAARANFYRVVGKFGESFLIAEDEYLRYAGGDTGDRFPIKKGGLHNEQGTCEQPAGLP